MQRIFKDGYIPPFQHAFQAKLIFLSLKFAPKEAIHRQLTHALVAKYEAWRYFDGASQGTLHVLDLEQKINFKVGLREGSNNLLRFSPKTSTKNGNPKRCSKNIGVW